ncbi:hypothetical protein pneo_cds_506 [Pandoravirus neocaledonia]|uniref:Uncharacterized protein n=1 Tax=Pandoravirus neocaledonia TaxID=2107708 RepID=A0A2U7UCF5_9VIRU|nr:hypothetical protein pneo_cds_506 [Pandoravirus neocaledonia]AVK76113.1 hypothetical protein pneo_cds_506 [Pandoravirus neocaledonia]
MRPSTVAIPTSRDSLLARWSAPALVAVRNTDVIARLHARLIAPSHIADAMAGAARCNRVDAVLLFLPRCTEASAISHAACMAARHRSTSATLALAERCATFDIDNALLDAAQTHDRGITLAIVPRCSRHGVVPHCNRPRARPRSASSPAPLLSAHVWATRSAQSHGWCCRILDEARRHHALRRPIMTTGCLTRR